MLEKRNNAGIIVALIAVIVAFTAVFVSVSAQMKMDRLELKAADEQTVARMNGVLASEELAEMPLTPVRVRSLLYSEGIQKYTPAVGNTRFGWFQEKNQIVIYEIVDGLTKVLYPYEYQGIRSGVWNLEVNTVATADDLMVKSFNAEPGSVIQLTEDITIDSSNYQSVVFNSGIFLDLNGHTVSMGGNADFYFQVHAESESDEKINIVIENGKISDISDGQGIRENENSGILDLFVGRTDSKPLEVVLKDVTIQANKGSIAIEALSAATTDLILENVNIKGITLLGTHSTTIEGGTYTGNAGDGAVVYANRPLTINGGTFTATGDQYVIYTADASPSQGLIINGGTFVGGKEDDDADGAAEVIGHITTPVLIHINGGVFNGEQYLGARVNDSYTGNIEAICREERVVFS